MNTKRNICAYLCGMYIIKQDLCFVIHLWTCRRLYDDLLISKETTKVVICIFSFFFLFFYYNSRANSVCSWVPRRCKIKYPVDSRTQSNASMWVFSGSITGENVTCFVICITLAIRKRLDLLPFSPFYLFLWGW